MQGLSGMYPTTAAKAKQAVTENNSGYLLCCYVVDNEAKAQEEAKHFLWCVGETTRGSVRSSPLLPRRGLSLQEQGWPSTGDLGVGTART